MISALSLIPRVSDSKAAVLRITTNAADHPEVNVMLQGTAKALISPEIRVTSPAFFGAYNEAVGMTWQSIVRLWGANWSGQLGIGIGPSQLSPMLHPTLTGISQVSANQYYSLAVQQSDGSIWAFGRNEFGQLGDGTTETRYQPVRVLNADSTLFQGAVSGAGHAIF